MKRGIFSFLILFLVCQAKAQLIINEVSQGTSGNKEYIELVVTGTRQCVDTAADLRGWIVDDNGGWYGTSAISQGCYRFANVASWASVPYGSIILLYNNGEKNDLITQPDDLTDANRDGVYIVPITANVIELNSGSPNSGMGSTFSYPNTGFSASTSWTPMAFNNNGDAVAVIKPTALNVAYHAMTYGNLSGGVHVNGSGGQKVYFVSGSQYNASAGWISGSAPSQETPGAPNTPANATWITGMRNATSGVPYNDTTKATICSGQSYAFNGNNYTATGIYSFTYPLPGGCDSIITLDLKVKPTPAAPVSVTPVTYCEQDIATALTATGTSLLWYTVATGGTGNAVAPVPVTTTAGTTIFYVAQSADGCESARTPVTVIVKTRPVAPTVVTPVNYCQRETAVALAATGTNLLWYTVATGGTNTAIVPVPSTVVPGVFTWYVTQSADGCESTRSQIDVTVHGIQTAFTFNKDTVCTNDTLKIKNTSAGNGLTYQWSFGDGGTDIVAEPIHIYAGPGNYDVKLVITNNVGCKDSLTKRVNILPLPTLSFLIEQDTICQGQAIDFNGVISPYYQQITWDFGDGLQTYNEERVQHSYDQHGTFIATIKTVNKGCPDRFFSDTITVRPHPVVNIGHDTALCPGNAPILLTNLVANSTAVTYRWNNNSAAAQLIAKEPGTYWLEVSNGLCSNTDSVEIVKSCYIDIPNSFTPNGDGLNDYFFPRQFLSRDLTAFDLQVVNRWGELVFETKELTGRGWDGQFNGQGQPQGVYIYIIKASFANGTVEKHQGNVSLLR